jgi:hypothetical protein
MQTTQGASDFARGEGHPFLFMHCWEIIKDESKWQETKQTKGSCQTPYEASTDPFMAPSPSVGTNSPLAGTSSGKRPLGRDATKAARISTRQEVLSTKVKAKEIQTFRHTSFGNA